MNDPRREPHWVVLLIVATGVGLLITWFGINDWRIPGFESASPPGSSDKSTQAHGETAPVIVTSTGDGGIDVNWTAVDDQQLHEYMVTVTAVRPVTYEFAAPHFDGERETYTRLHPADYLNEALAEEGDERRVKDGQVWYVCVQGLREAPMNEDLVPYMITGTRACSADFTLP